MMALSYRVFAGYEVPLSHIGPVVRARPHIVDHEVSTYSDKVLTSHNLEKSRWKSEVRLSDHRNETRFVTRSITMVRAFDRA